MSSKLHLVIYGIVQGVGFRYATYRKAVQLGLRGWVRNKKDGTVEAVFDGPEEKVQEMLLWCHKGPLGAKVSHVDVSWEETSENYTTFEIKY
ncbi:MAG TPA: acylphosphatase [Candidatus Hydrogenedens sp.]|nr:acylphosphatase [Candidatus Hydrogenedens sp.]HOK08292.1 acylphosphatase [Candidatus Hydrogenedens sp.]HOL18914.1 acylphosphatase [Candidatus Hydrogenedens sp.]HPP57586.1 acylphosphatase [Candidatus Hydrogenedens sp.]